MGHPVLNDPDVVVGHRFRNSDGSDAERHPEIWANRLRMARKNFGDSTWEDWLDRFRRRHDESLTEGALAVFESRRQSVEEERDYLIQHRQHDEFWFAEHFNLRWPQQST
jgi:hypothetical protein